MWCVSDRVPQSGYSALMWAVLWGQHAVAELLVAAGANVYFRDEKVRRARAITPT